ncbi:MAG: hypothetical protein WCO52_05905 [bacterium]
MPRPFGDKLLLELDRSTSTNMGLKLARLCIEAKIPAAYTAVALEASKTTVHKWFRGMGVRESRSKAVKAFIEMLERDLADGTLPAKSLKDAKFYIAAAIGTEF